MKSLLSLPYLFTFFWLDPKEPKSQERKDIHHFSFISPDQAAVLLWLQHLSPDA